MDSFWRKKRWKCGPGKPTLSYSCNVCNLYWHYYVKPNGIRGHSINMWHSKRGRGRQCVTNTILLFETLFLRRLKVKNIVWSKLGFEISQRKSEKCHTGEKGGKKRAKKVSRIIWMGLYNNHIYNEFVAITKFSNDLVLNRYFTTITRL